jgi:hypothetical protein
VHGVQTFPSLPVEHALAVLGHVHAPKVPSHICLLMQDVQLVVPQSVYVFGHLQTPPLHTSPAPVHGVQTCPSLPVEHALAVLGHVHAPKVPSHICLLMQDVQLVVPQSVYVFGHLQTPPLHTSPAPVHGVQTSPSLPVEHALAVLGHVQAPLEHCSLFLHATHNPGAPQELGVLSHTQLPDSQC